jgi:hypothetical protein
MAHHIRIGAIGLLLTAAAVSSATAQTQVGRVGVRGGAGTDVSLGVAYGAGVNYLITTGNNSFEPGLLFFGGKFSEDSTSGSHTYTEDTKVFVFALMGNFLFNYSPDRSSTFFVLGFGLGAMSVDWTESSPTDTSLGAPLPGGGSTHSDDGTAAGSIFNVGFGRSFGRMDVRAEVPVLLTFAPPGGASSVVPTFIVTGGYRF